MLSRYKALNNIVYLSKMTKEILFKEFQNANIMRYNVISEVANRTNLNSENNRSKTAIPKMKI